MLQSLLVALQSRIRLSLAQHNVADLVQADRHIPPCLGTARIARQQALGMLQSLLVALQSRIRLSLAHQHVAFTKGRNHHFAG